MKPTRNALKRMTYPFRRMHFFNRPLNWLGFVLSHQRLPKKSGGSFNDIMYRIKRDELEDPLRVFVSDKELAKIYIKSIVGGQHLPETMLVTSRIEDLRDVVFDGDVVLKPTHMSAEIIFLDAGQRLTEAQIAEISKWLKVNYYHVTGEINYHTLETKVIVERKVDFEPLYDYKFFMKNARLLFVQIHQDRFGTMRNIDYDAGWNKLPFTLKKPLGRDVEKPANFDQMLAFAERLAADFDFIRVDFYTDGHRLLVGELTNCHGSAQEWFLPSEKWDFVVGQYMLDPKACPLLSDYIENHAGT